MDSFLFALGAIAPLILVVAVGYWLKVKGIFAATSAKAVNRVVFKILIPSTVFLNIYNIENIGDIELTYLFYVAALTLAVFIISLPLSGVITKNSSRRGVISQVMYRSNYALIGLPLVESIYGNGGMAEAALLSVVSVSMFNVFAVISLSVFGENKKGINVKKILVDIVKNPLIQAIFIGLIMIAVRAALISCDINFRLSQITPLFTAIGYLSKAATPVALLCLGAQFEFSAIKGMRREIVCGVAIRTIIVPLIGLGLAYLLFDFTGAMFAALIAAFATPVSVSSAPMAQEMGGDSILAGQLVLWTTVVSSVTLFLFIYALRVLNVF